MKGSAITGPVGKEAADLWPVSHSRPRQLISQLISIPIAYCLQLRCRDVNSFLFLAFLINKISLFYRAQSGCNANSPAIDSFVLGSGVTTRRRQQQQPRQRAYC